MNFTHTKMDFDKKLHDVNKELSKNCHASSSAYFFSKKKQPFQIKSDKTQDDSTSIYESSRDVDEFCRKLNETSIYFYKNDHNHEKKLKELKPLVCSTPFLLESESESNSYFSKSTTTQSFLESNETNSILEKNIEDSCSTSISTDYSTPCYNKENSSFKYENISNIPLQNNELIISCRKNYEDDLHFKNSNQNDSNLLNINSHLIPCHVPTFHIPIMQKPRQFRYPSSFKPIKKVFHDYEKNPLLNSTNERNTNKTYNNHNFNILLNNSIEGGSKSNFKKFQQNRNMLPSSFASPRFSPLSTQYMHDSNFVNYYLINDFNFKMMSSQFFYLRQLTCRFYPSMQCNTNSRQMFGMPHTFGNSRVLMK